MQEFFGDVEYVKRNILVIRNSTTRIGEINQQVKLNHTNNYTSLHHVYSASGLLTNLPIKDHLQYANLYADVTVLFMGIKEM